MIIGNKIILKQQYKALLLIIVFILGLVIFVFAEEEKSEDLILETPYAAEGKVDEIIQLKEAGDIQTFQEKLEDFISSVFPSLRPPVIYDVKVENITTSSATILWKTNVKSNSIVALAEDSEYDSKKDNPYKTEFSDIESKVIDHKIIVDRLKPGTLYHFQVKSASLSGVIGKSKDFTFSTLSSKIKLEIGKITNNEIIVKWITPQKTDSYVEYKDLTTGKIYQTKLEERTNLHSLVLQNLTPGTSYQIRGFGYDEKNILVETDSVVVKTKKDATPPVISNIKINSALVPNSKDQALTIITWLTNEPSNSLVYYDIGLGINKNLKNKIGNEDSYSLEHSVVIPTKAGSIYRLNIVSYDESGNRAESGVRSIFTPRGEQSLLEIMIRNFEETFKFLKRR